MNKILDGMTKEDLNAVEDNMKQRKNIERTLEADTFKDITTMTIELTIHELDLIRNATWALEAKIIADVQDHTKSNYQSAWLKKNNEIRKAMFFASDSLRKKIIHEVHNSEEFYGKERKTKGFDLSEYKHKTMLDD